ncbi:piggyBac transposable element-derived protein 3-like [Schistocerca piceifrons]|uniref:piggyBac transposable element-derived protein 3-like n=1 Tax=Schistocerca piceifrons TaxID=274613 RepID=UPI001F5F32AB|nr:piggyBac transposable element-derived protein 3-like [Schistocerca piceifrons]
MAGYTSKLRSEEILELLLNGDVSDLEISEEEDGDFDLAGDAVHQSHVPSPSEQSSSCTDNSDDDESSSQNRRMFWEKCERFEGPQATFSPTEVAEHNEKQIMDYFQLYFDLAFFKDTSELTNMRYLQQTGRSLKLSAKEVQIFIGATILMSCLRYPRVRMYWGKTTRVISITEIMTRDRYFSIRSNLKVTDDNAVTEETRRKDKLWKIRPLLERVKRACLSLPRSPEVAVDEQMIPFTGACAIKQFVRGKPNPEGLKNFVLAAPSGLVLDFEIYQGKGTFPEAIGQQLKQGIGASAVLRLCQSLPEGTHVFFDRYFTSVPLLESLAEKNLPATGTIMKSRIPRAVHLTADKILPN